MAHFDFILRGNRIDTKKFLNNVESMYFQTKYKKKLIMYNVVLRPIQLWEAIAKEEDMPMVIKSINPLQRNPYVKKYATVLRKMMKLQKVPEIDEAVKRRAIWIDNIEVVPIGYKKDLRDKNDEELL